MKNVNKEVAEVADSLRELEAERQELLDKRIQASEAQEKINKKYHELLQLEGRLTTTIKQKGFRIIDVDEAEVDFLLEGGNLDELPIENLGRDLKKELAAARKDLDRCQLLRSSISDKLGSFSTQIQQTEQIKDQLIIKGAQAATRDIINQIGSDKFFEICVAFNVWVYGGCIYTTYKALKNLPGVPDDPEFSEKYQAAMLRLIKRAGVNKFEC